MIYSCIYYYYEMQYPIPAESVEQLHKIVVAK